jgi:hypothetical protein
MYYFGYFPGVRLCTLHPAFEDGTDRGFRNVGKSQSDAGEIPKRIHTIIFFSNLCPLVNPSGRSAAFEPTQLLTDMSTGDIARGAKAAGADGYRLPVPNV